MNKNITKTIKFTLFFIVIALVFYFFYIEFVKNWSSIKDYKPKFNSLYLSISLLFALASYMADTYIWKFFINHHLHKDKINFLESVAVVNTSGLLKYLPGRIWVYATQLLWLSKKGISKTLVTYINVISILSSMIVSLFLSMIYICLYSQVLNVRLSIILLLLFLLADVFFILYNTLFMNKLISIIKKLFNRDVRPFKISRRMLFYIQVMHFANWLITGFWTYMLAKGIGLEISTLSVFALLASLSASWTIGYLAVFTPGGLGVRESIMYLMLNNVVNVQTSLILPIASRVLSLISEMLLGLVGIILGMKYKIFSGKSNKEA